MAFEDLWGGSSLVICLREGVFTKLLPDGKPAPSQPKVDVSIVSAVYGSGDKFSDVTDRVKQAGRLPFRTGCPQIGGN